MPGRWIVTLSLPTGCSRCPTSFVGRRSLGDVPEPSHSALVSGPPPPTPSELVGVDVCYRLAAPSSVPEDLRAEQEKTNGQSDNHDGQNRPPHDAPPWRSIRLRRQYDRHSEESTRKKASCVEKPWSQALSPRPW